MNVKLRRHVRGKLEIVVEEVKEKLSKWGFGGFCRINMHEEILGKVGKRIIPTVIITACHPELSYEAYQANADISSLLPCNAVMREIDEDIISIELVRPTFLMSMIGERKLADLAREIDRRLLLVIDSFNECEVIHTQGRSQIDNPLRM